MENDISEIVNIIFFVFINKEGTFQIKNQFSYDVI